MATPIDMLILALEATGPEAGTFRCRHRFNAEVMILTLDHGVPAGPAGAAAEALHPASAAVASDCSAKRARRSRRPVRYDDRQASARYYGAVRRQGQAIKTIVTPSKTLCRLSLRTVRKAASIRRQQTIWSRGDYSSSGSSWAPDQQSSSDSESELPLKKIKTRPTKNYSKQKGKEQPRLKPALSTRRTPNRLLKKILERQTYDLGRRDASNSNLFQKYAKCRTFRKSDDKGKINIAKIKMALIASSEISEIKRKMKIIKETVQKLKTLSSNLMTTLLGAGKGSCKSQSPDFPTYNVEGVAFDTLHGGDEKSANELNQGTPLTTEAIRDRSRNYIEIAERCSPHGELGTNQENESEIVSKKHPQKHTSARRQKTH
ncbi:hypothetical protein EVAR_51397_1 [Eumeta japonica]|uniref:Uncharacterized protein n=1 Tax=Eumeta variegata TaxID=151549 RepID=A0A4C1ZU58_EUMVA|nr:hypothetical protein EVAR_51397_1 [Eumeta japonica]